MALLCVHPGSTTQIIPCANISGSFKFSIPLPFATSRYPVRNLSILLQPLGLSFSTTCHKVQLLEGLMLDGRMKRNTSRAGHSAAVQVMTQRLPTLLDNPGVQSLRKDQEYLCRTFQLEEIQPKSYLPILLGLFHLQLRKFKPARQF